MATWTQTGTQRGVAGRQSGHSGLRVVGERVGREHSEGLIDYLLLLLKGENWVTWCVEITTTNKKKIVFKMCYTLLCIRRQEYSRTFYHNLHIYSTTKQWCQPIMKSKLL